MTIYGIGLFIRSGTQSAKAQTNSQQRLFSNETFLQLDFTNLLLFKTTRSSHQWCTKPRRRSRRNWAFGAQSPHGSANLDQSAQARSKRKSSHFMLFKLSSRRPNWPLSVFVVPRIHPGWTRNWYLSPVSKAPLATMFHHHLSPAVLSMLLNPLHQTSPKAHDSLLEQWTAQGQVQ